MARQTFRNLVPLWYLALPVLGALAGMFAVWVSVTVLWLFQKQPVESAQYYAALRTYYGIAAFSIIDLLIMVYLSIQFWMCRRNSMMVVDEDELVWVDCWGRTVSVPWEKVHGLRTMRNGRSKHVSIDREGGRTIRAEWIPDFQKLVDAVVSKAHLTRLPDGLIYVRYGKTRP